MGLCLDQNTADPVYLPDVCNPGQAQAQGANNVVVRSNESIFPPVTIDSAAAMFNAISQPTRNANMRFPANAIFGPNQFISPPSKIRPPCKGPNCDAARELYDVVPQRS